MLRALGKGLVGVLLALGVIEFLLRLLPVSTATMLGYYTDPEILVYPPHHEWHMSTGWDLRNPQPMRSNTAGFAAEREFVPDPRAVALVGDSYIEASMLPWEDRLAARLEGAMTSPRPVYAMGAPGSSLLDYAERVRFASQRFGVRDFVLLVEAGDLRQSLCGSQNVHSACLDRQTLQPRRERFAEPGTLKQVLRYSALAQYLFGQLKLDSKRVLEATFKRTTPEMVAAAKAGGTVREHPALTPEAVDVIVGHFLERVRPFRQGKMVVILDGRRIGPPRQIGPLDLERLRAKRRFEEAGIVIVDAEALWGQHLAGSPLSVEVGPYDKHLNPLALRLLGQATAKALEQP